ncbi:MAG: protein kinase [Lachnospiraceae bacterium]|nr:protein kinase [Lachnospiraceae bacterium]
MEKNLLSGVWPEWEIVRQLGRGSYGVVYEAVRIEHGVESRAAVKIITIPQDESELQSLRAEGLSEDDTRKYLEGIVNDFVGEIQLMESFKGVQNIVSVEDYKVVEQTEQIGFKIYIRMELLTPFNSVISEKAMTEPEVIKLGTDICTALELCAKKKVIHRDIKPENIFVNQFGDYKLGDFGIARKLENVTGGMSQKGTYNYMAPEVEKGTQYDGGVDLYSLGLVLYRFLNHNLLPFLSPENQLNPNERMAAVRRRLDGEALPAPSGASPAMAAVILKACSFDPALRYQGATEMKNALQGVLSGKAEEEDFLNKTVSVRHAKESAVPNPDMTTAVHRAPESAPEAKAPAGFLSDLEKKLPPKKILLGAAAGIVVLIIIIAAAVKSGKKGEETIAENTKTETGVTGETTEEKQPTDTPEGPIGLDPSPEGLPKLDPPDETPVPTEIPEGPEIDPAQAEALAKAMKDAQESADRGDYAAAKKAVDTYEAEYGESEELNAAMEPILAKYKEEALAEADAGMAEEDYIGAMAKIREAEAVLPEDPDIKAKGAEIEDSAVSETLTQTDTLVKQGNYTAAEALLTSVQAAFPDNARLKTAAADLKEQKEAPLYLFDYDPASVTNAYLCLFNNDPNRFYSFPDPWGNYPYTYDSGWKMQSGGKTYQRGMALTVASDYSPATIVYNNLNGEFSRLTGKAAFEDKWDDRIDSSYQINIYADSSRVGSYTIRKGAAPTAIDVDLDYSSTLTIELAQPANDYSIDPNINLLDFAVIR